MPRSIRLRVEPLEPRDVPAGNVTAVVTNGVLVITGDEAGNALGFQISPDAVTINPFGGTSVNGQPADAQVTLPGALGLSADLGEGDDRLNLFGASDVADSAVDLNLPKGVKVALGDGKNSLNLVTSGIVDLASLTMTGGDGFDLVRVGGGAGKPNRIAGAASFMPGDGGSSTRLSNLDLPGADGLKVTAAIGEDDLILTDVAVTKAVTAKLGQGAPNDVTVTGGSVGSLTTTSLGGTLKLTNTTVKGNATIIGAEYPEADVTDSTVIGTLTVKSTQPLVGDAIVNFYGTGAVGGVVIDAVNQALVFFNPSSSYTVTRDVTATARNRAVAMTLNGASLTARNLSATSKMLSTTLYVSNASQLTLSKDLNLSSIDGTTLQVDTGSHLKADGDLKVSATALSANFFVSESDLMARNVSVTAPSGTIFAGLSGPNPASINLTGRLTLTGGNQAYWGQPAGTLSAAGGITVTGQSRSSFTQGGGSVTTAGDLTIASRDAAGYSEAGADATSAIGGNLKVQAQAGLMSFSATGKSLSVGGATTLDGGYAVQLKLSTIDVSTLTEPVRITGGTRATFAMMGPKKADLSDLIFGNVDVELPDHPLVEGSYADFELSAPPNLRTKPRSSGSRASSGADVDILIGGSAGPVTIDGNLLIHTAGASDSIALRDLTVTGNTDISTGGGNDTLTIDDGSTFTGTFVVDLGSGNDTISIAQDAGQGAPVTFTGKATILARAGADTLLLGSTSGDANSMAVFAAAGSKIVGGSGINPFDDELGQFSGLILGTGILAWTDPTP